MGSHGNYTVKKVGLFDYVGVPLVRMDVRESAPRGWRWSWLSSAVGCAPSDVAGAGGIGASSEGVAEDGAPRPRASAPSREGCGEGRNRRGHGARSRTAQPKWTFAGIQRSSGLLWSAIHVYTEAIGVTNC